MHFAFKICTINNQMHTTLCALGYQIESIKHQKGIKSAFYQQQNSGVDKKSQIIHFIGQKEDKFEFSLLSC